MTTEALVLQSTPIITFGYIMQVFFSLLVILALLYITGRYFLPRIKTAGKGKMIEIVDRVYLEPQVYAYVIKVGKDSWFVMSGNKQVTRIDKLEESTI
ncbi:MAG: hypothetical protein ABIE84_00995 [bacterium]